MRRLLIIIAMSGVSAISLSLSGFTQIPAGPPYQPGTHSNPIVSFATADDFKPSTYDEARNQADLDLLGLSASEGTRESISITESYVDEIKILGSDVDVLFYPVVRQTFRLVDGDEFLLYSFKDPRPTGIPSSILASVLNEHAFRPDRKPEESRFGPGERPEQLEIRGSAALLFDDSENGGNLTLFWQDEIASHVAVAKVSRQRMFRIVEDLL